MKFSIFLQLLLCGVVVIASEDEFVMKRACSFNATVDLTNLTSFANRSYVYQNVLIPMEKQDFYEHIYRFNNRKIPVKKHLRGCVCSEAKPCIKLCCPKNEFFNTTSEICEMLPDDSEVSWNLPINKQNVNVFDKFIYQVGLPCDIPEALVQEGDDWSLLENGLVLIAFDSDELNTLDYCFSPYLFNDTDEYTLVPLSCAVQNEVTWQIRLNSYAMVVSVIFLIPTILVYLAVKELRGNLRGKLLICYLLSMAIGYGIIGFINISEIRFNPLPCGLLGFTCYFFFMSAFLWLSVLCYDIWNNFKETNVELNSNKNFKRFFYYSLYAWGLALVCTLLCIAAEFSEIDRAYKPGIGDFMCFLNTEKWSASIYFYGPNLIILIFNFVTFALLTKRIYKVRRDLAKMTQKDKFFQENAVVILRLFLIMGISWLFDILSYCLRLYPKFSFIFVLSDLGNAIQGLLIFSLFVMKPNVLNLLKKKFNSNTETAKPRRSTSSSTNISKLTSTSASQPLVGQPTS